MTYFDEFSIPVELEQFYFLPDQSSLINCLKVLKNIWWNLVKIVPGEIWWSRELPFKLAPGGASRISEQSTGMFFSKNSKEFPKTLTNRKSSSLFAILWKRPPTRAAKWITWVGLCFWKIASVALRSTKSPSLEDKKIQVSLFDASSSFTTWTKKTSLTPAKHESRN